MRSSKLRSGLHDCRSRNAPAGGNELSMPPADPSFYPDPAARCHRFMSEGSISNELSAGAPRSLPSFESLRGRQIVELHLWAVRQGLLGAAADALFDGLCRRLVEAGVPLSRAFAGMRTLHPQWAGYGYTWRRESGVEPAQFERGLDYETVVANSPYACLMNRLAEPGYQGPPWAYLRRRLAGPAAQLDFPVLAARAAAGGTDYFAMLVAFGAGGDPARGTGIGYSFETGHSEGFSEDDLLLLKAVLPAVSLAIMGDAGHTIAAGLLATYIGADAGRRVHEGAVTRGSVETVFAVLWYADIRGFTAIADTTTGRAVVEMLDEVFETLTVPLRRRGAQVLKFLGDGMLATFPIGPGGVRQNCGSALDAAVEAMHDIDRLNAARRRAGKPAVAVDLALHIGEVLYGNVGAADRLDFTVIGPAVNEAARIEALCEPLGARVLVSAELAGAAGDPGRLRSLGRHPLRGVREPREIFALELGARWRHAAPQR
jgi:adenylate cyclase